MSANNGTVSKRGKKGKKVKSGKKDWPGEGEVMTAMVGFDHTAVLEAAREDARRMHLDCHREQVWIGAVLGTIKADGGSQAAIHTADQILAAYDERRATAAKPQFGLAAS